MKNPNLAASSHGNIPHLKLGKVKPIKIPNDLIPTSQESHTFGHFLSF